MHDDDWVDTAADDPVEYDRAMRMMADTSTKQDASITSFTVPGRYPDKAPRTMSATIPAGYEVVDSGRMTEDYLVYDIELYDFVKPNISVDGEYVSNYYCVIRKKP